MNIETQTKIEQLEKELEQLKAIHKSAAETYGSELCAGDMIRKEEELESQIKILKGKEECKDALDPTMETLEKGFNDVLITVATSTVRLRRKIVTVEKYLQSLKSTLSKKDDN